jgi:hypothetical protein
MPRSGQLIVLAAAMLTAGCNPATQGQPESSPPPPPPSSTTASSSGLAPIDGFPDTSGYTETDERDYFVNTPHLPGLNFSTSDGLSCWLGAYPSAEEAYASCTGPRPDKGPGKWDVSAHRGEAGVIEIAPPPANPNYIEPTPLALPLMHLLAYEVDQLCAVDDKGTVACRVGDHGFVLTPTSTMLY